MQTLENTDSLFHSCLQSTFVPKRANRCQAGPVPSDQPHSQCTVANSRLNVNITPGHPAGSGITPVGSGFLPVLRQQL